ncbi:unnamed protein product [Durusdinium trenchii]|uniref:CSD domain-containing protein n=1 Tax=Durusdinium trenchii TaxID=1381693 RepID=A0ABP0M417_9DINO
MSRRGTVKFYNSVDGYGFIRSGSQSRPGAPEVYVHRSAIADGQMLVRGDQDEEIIETVPDGVIEEEGRLNALRVTGGSGGYGLTHGCKVDRSTVKDLRGTIKKFFPEKGWGFIIQEQGGPNLFFHSNQLDDGSVT